MTARMGLALLPLLAIVPLSGCIATESHSNVGIEGAPAKADTRLLEAGAATLQSHPPSPP